MKRTSARTLTSLLLILALFCALPGLGAGATGPLGGVDIEIHNEATGLYEPASADLVNLTLDGEALDLSGDVPALVQTVDGFGRTLVPLRTVSEPLGATVLWVSDNRQVILRKGSSTVVLTLGSATAVVNGVETELPDGVPACVVRRTVDGKRVERTMVPLRFVSEQLGAAVGWDQDSYTAKIVRPVSRTTQIERVAADADALTVLIGTDRTPEYQVADYQDRVVVDLLNAELSSGFPGTISVDNDFITTVRYAAHGAGFIEGYDKVVRVVLDLKDGITLDKNVKVEQKDDGVLITTYLNDDEHGDVDFKPTVPLDPSKKTIVVDAGHGGYKSGAVYEDIQEKDLTLSISKKLEAILREQGYNVVMTRSEDVYMDLYERSDIANAVEADLFVSVHCNASATNRDFQGIFTYYHPSSNRGRNLALAIQGPISKATGGIDRGVLADDFVVLRETEMCAVLVETGFMTNHEELMRLSDDSYQDKLAAGIAEGITQYLNSLN